VAIARASQAVRDMVAPADFSDISRVVNVNDQRAAQRAESAVSAAGMSALFAHGESGNAFVNGSAGRTGGKRSIGSVYSGAYEDISYNADKTAFGVKNSLEIPVQFQERLDRAFKISDRLTSLAAVSVLVAPITINTIQSWYDNNVAIPLDILGERPFRRYETASAIFAAGGESLGEIAWAKFDVHVSSNANTKEFSGNASIWGCAIVKREERYFIAEDVLVCGYHGGESLVPFSARGGGDRDFRPATVHMSPASVFYFMVPAGSLRGRNAVPRTHDIRGRFDDTLVDGRLNAATRSAIEGKPHYPSALYYNMVYQFRDLNTVTEEDLDYFKLQGRHDNTVTHQTMQWMWNPKSGEWDRPILNTDHFGVNIYEGHGDLRTMGRAKHYEDAGYMGKYAPVD